MGGIILFVIGVYLILVFTKKWYYHKHHGKPENARWYWLELP